MYGAIAGDMIGSIYEFEYGRHLDRTEFFKDSSSFTDDTVMTVAVGEALMNSGKDASIEKIKKNLIKSMQKYGKLYPDAGYGEKFSQWLKDKKPIPYCSCGNGSAMRVSSVGWMYDSLERTRKVASATAEVSHNHPEGVKGAEAVASAIYLSRVGKSKQEISDYITAEFGYDFNISCDKLRSAHITNTLCQVSVPEAFVAFLNGNNFEDVIQIIISFGGDSDTLAAIAGSIAEAYYGVPEWMKVECKKRLDSKMLHVLQKFKTMI